MVTASARLRACLRVGSDEINQETFSPLPIVSHAGSFSRQRRQRGNGTIIKHASPITVPYKTSPTAHSSKTSWAPAGCPTGEPKRKQQLPGRTRMKRRTSLSLPFRSFLLALTCFSSNSAETCRKIDTCRRAFYGYNVHRKRVM